MDGQNIIAWTPANWITVLLMVFIGFAIAGFVSQIVMQKRSQKAA